VYEALGRRSEITAATLLDVHAHTGAATTQPAHSPSKKAEASIAPPRRTNTAAPKDHGYAVISALALAVEAVEALCTFLSDCDPGLTAAVRPSERTAL
jgi:hypothetical protein